MQLKVVYGHPYYSPKYTAWYCGPGCLKAAGIDRGDAEWADAEDFGISSIPARDKVACEHCGSRVFPAGAPVLD